MTAVALFVVGTAVGIVFARGVYRNDVTELDAALHHAYDEVDEVRARLHAERAEVDRLRTLVHPSTRPLRAVRGER